MIVKVRLGSGLRWIRQSIGSGIANAVIPIRKRRSVNGASLIGVMPAYFAWLNPVDLNMVEQTQAYNGLYYVLMGRISPLDGLGPRNLRLEQLVARAGDGVVREVILATNFTNEGEATAHFVSELLKKKGLKVSRIARGVPVGGELEFVDSGTLAQALRERRRLES